MPVQKISMDPLTGKTIYTDIIGKADAAEVKYGDSADKGYGYWATSEDQKASTALGNPSAVRTNTQRPSAQPVTPLSAQPTNNMAMINQQNDAALQSTIAAIKAAVQQAKGKQQQIIQKAPQEYGNLKNIVYGQSVAALPGMQENTANLGASSQGGYNRTMETRASSELQNRLSEIDRQKQNVIDQANFTIADLESRGMMDEANATKDTALAKLQQIVAESSRLDALNNQNYWNTEQMSQDNYWKNVNQSNYNQQAEASKTQQDWENEFKQQGYSDDQAYRAATLKLQQQSANGSNTPSKNDYSADALNDVQAALSNGTPYNVIRQNILNNAAGYQSVGINYKTILDAVDQAEKQATANQNDVVNNRGGSYIPRILKGGFESSSQYSR